MNSQVTYCIGHNGDGDSSMVTVGASIGIIVTMSVGSLYKLLLYYCLGNDGLNRVITVDTPIGIIVTMYLPKCPMTINNPTNQNTRKLRIIYFRPQILLAHCIYRKIYCNEKLTWIEKYMSKRSLYQYYRKRGTFSMHSWCNCDQWDKMAGLYFTIWLLAIHQICPKCIILPKQVKFFVKH